ncbi:MAG TPA: hypothetical protein VIG99_32005, partial [Myxococcaceae bacterium]
MRVRFLAAMLLSPPALPLACGDHSITCEEAIAAGGETIEDGVTKYSCMQETVVITVERSRTDLEMW